MADSPTPPVDRLSWRKARSMTPMQRATHYSALDGDCVVFLGAATAGYGIFQAEGRTHRIHEWGWEQHNGGPAEEGMELHHLCGVKRCWNVDHLVLLSAAEHTTAHGGARGGGLTNRAKVVCKWGHDFTHVNTYVEKNGKRRCRACAASAARRTRATKKEVSCNG